MISPVIILDCIPENIVSGHNGIEPLQKSSHRSPLSCPQQLEIPQAASLLLKVPSARICRACCSSPRAALSRLILSPSLCTGQEASHSPVSACVLGSEGEQWGRTGLGLSVVPPVWCRVPKGWGCRPGFMESEHLAEAPVLPKAHPVPGCCTPIHSRLLSFSTLILGTKSPHGVGGAGGSAGAPPCRRSAAPQRALQTSVAFSSFRVDNTVCLANRLPNCK